MKCKHKWIPVQLEPYIIYDVNKREEYDAFYIVYVCSKCHLIKKIKSKNKPTLSGW